MRGERRVPELGQKQPDHIELRKRESSEGESNDGTNSLEDHGVGVLGLHDERHPPDVGDVVHGQHVLLWHVAEERLFVWMGGQGGEGGG
jgi:hypothetical protein